MTTSPYYSRWLHHKCFVLIRIFISPPSPNTRTTFNLNRCRQSATCSPKLYFVTLHYIGLLTVRRPHALSKCKHTSPSVAPHESAAWNSWHFIPLISLCTYLKNFFIFFPDGQQQLVRIPRKGRGICTSPKCSTQKRSAKTRGSVKHAACRLEHQLHFQLLLFNLLYYSILELYRKIPNQLLSCPTAISEIKVTLT